MTCRVGELLLPDLLQLEDLLQGLRDLGSTDADLLVLPHLKIAAIKNCGLTSLFKSPPPPPNPAYVRLGYLLLEEAAL